MKKLIGTAALAALLAASAFAELSMGAWIRTVVAPVVFDGDDVKAYWGNSWGGLRNARISFNWTSEDEKIGMMFDIMGDGASGFGSGDWRAAWFKPADWVKIMVGRIDDGYTMRSDLAYGSWNWLRPAILGYDEALTFGFDDRDGLQVELFPVEGLQILAHLALPAEGEGVDIWRAVGKSMAGVGYTIGDVGTVKVGFIGKNTNWKDEKTTTYGTAQVAFDLTAIENMFLTVGAKANLVYGRNQQVGEKNNQNSVTPAVGLRIGLADTLTLYVSALAEITDTSDVTIKGGVGLDVGLTDSLGLNVDCRILDDIENADFALSFLVGVNWGFASNGVLGIGFQGVAATSNAAGNCGFVGGMGVQNEKFAFAVPIKFEYSF